MNPAILIIDDEESIRYAFMTFLSVEGYEVLTAKDFPSAMEIISCRNLDLIFSDIILKNRSGIDLLRKIKENDLKCPVIMITGQPDVDTAAEAVRLGAFDYLVKPVRKDTILKVTKMALDHKALVDEKELIESENQRYRKNLEAIFRSVDEAILTIDNDIRILNANEALKTICGVAPERIIGKPFADIAHACPLFSEKVVRMAIEEKSDIKEYRINHARRDLSEQIVILNSSPLMDSEHRSIGTVIVLRDITKLAALERELEERRKFHRIIGKSKKMQQIFRLIEDLSEVETTVLISGESGTGKELAARALHHNGPRSSRPFVCINCSALSENLLESELFGHVKGSFTGAIKNKTGRFQEADGGTVFLDEIGDISPRIQLKLLRVVQEKEFERVGDSRLLKTDVRIITATNRDLRGLVKKGKFREDLYYRFKVVEIILPPLRDRPEDIPLLLNHFISRFNRQFGKNIGNVADEVLKIFMNYTWPGNIRELENAVEHAFVMCHDGQIAIEHIPFEISDFSRMKGPFSPKTTSVTDDILLKTLEQTRWNKAKTARLLGISRQTLYRRLKRMTITS